MNVEDKDVFARAIGHLRDFIDFKAGWWEIFCDGIGRAFAKLATQDPAAIDAENVCNWLMRQVSSALSVVLDVYGSAMVDYVIEVGRTKREKNTKYRIILSGRGA